MHNLIRLGSLALLFASIVPAALLSVGDRSKLGATDRLDWAVAGENYDALGSRLEVKSEGGLAVGVSQAGWFVRLDQSAGWYGNFAPGEHLLWNRGGGPVSFELGPAGLTALGFQIQTNLFESYTAQLDVFDAAGALMGSATGEGRSTQLGDGSALWLGILSDRSFYQARIRVTSGESQDDFAISTLYLATGPPATPAWNAPPLAPSASPVPEPATFTLGTLAVALIALARRKLR